MSEHYRLGPLPWSQEALKKKYWENFVDAYEAIKEHPGFALCEMLEDINTSLEIFLDQAEDLLSAIGTFKEEVSRGGLFTRRNRDRKSQLERLVRKSLFGVTSAAFALVDTSRRVSGEVIIQGYQERVKSTFAENELHRFLQGFRNASNHKAFLTPNWRHTLRPGEKTTQFLFKRETLDRFDKWDSLAKQFIAKHAKGVDLEQIILEYRDLVQQFYSWFEQQVLSEVETSMNDYLRCKKVLNAEGSRSWWRIILNEGIKRGIDPYERLDEYFVPSELEEIQSLSRGSREQVDLIIRMVDEYDACDTEIRSLVYRLFRIN